MRQYSDAASQPSHARIRQPCGATKELRASAAQELKSDALRITVALAHHGEFGPPKVDDTQPTARSGQHNLLLRHGYPPTRHVRAAHRLARPTGPGVGKLDHPPSLRATVRQRHVVEFATEVIADERCLGHHCERVAVRRNAASASATPEAKGVQTARSATVRASVVTAGWSIEADSRGIPTVCRSNMVVEGHRPLAA